MWRLLRRLQSDGPGRFMLLRGALYFGCAPIMVSTCCTHVSDMFSKKRVNSRSRFTGQFGIALILYFGSGFRDSFWDCFRGLIYVCFRGQF